jgi:hypothetical protein
VTISLLQAATTYSTSPYDRQLPLLLQFLITNRYRVYYSSLLQTATTSIASPGYKDRPFQLGFLLANTATTSIAISYAKQMAILFE